MTVVTTRVEIAEDGTISGHVSGQVPPGEHEAQISVEPLPPRRKPARPFDVNSLPSLDLGPWPVGLSLRREEIYVDDGR